jgi:hypothetical protein
MKLVYAGIELLRWSDRQYMGCIYHRLLLKLQSMELKAMNNTTMVSAVIFPLTAYARPSGNSAKRPAAGRDIIQPVPVDPLKRTGGIGWASECRKGLAPIEGCVVIFSSMHRDSRRRNS